MKCTGVLGVVVVLVAAEVELAATSVVVAADWPCSVQVAVLALALIGVVLVDLPCTGLAVLILVVTVVAAAAAVVIVVFAMH